MELSFSASFPNIQKQQAMLLQNLLFDFQNSIKQGNVSQVTDLIDQGLSVNQALPNGELPLHFAVRLGKHDVVLALLKSGADPEVQDFQKLSAIDHAALMKNESMIANILGYKIGQDLKTVQEQMQRKGSASHVHQLKNKIQKISTVNVQKLNVINQAAYQGNLDKLTQSLSSYTLNELDANGLAPIHYAILGNQNAAVEKLIALGAKINIMNKEGDSLLHFAAISSSSQILNQLIHSGIDLNHKNLCGATALHYASAQENLSAVESLVKAGANPYFLDNRGMSPLAMIGTSAFERDPLSLPKTQVVLFAATSLYWLSLLAITSGWVTSDSAQRTAILLMVGALITANWSEFGVLVTNLNKTWKKVIAWIGMFGFSAIPPFNIGFQAWKTYYVARSAFEGLKNCWNNIGYRNWAVMRNVTVYSVNTAQSTYVLYRQCAVTYELFLYASQQLKMWMALQCANIQSSTLAELSTMERMLKPELKPHCPEHALMMMSPEFTMEQLREQKQALYKQAYFQALKEIHPDKAGPGEPILDRTLATERLNEARETLDQWVKENT
ncbi:MAG TPA: ankyrin repeat domain-containing protein [Chlamydiales bacterium]|nr:ankyrin repeat domain-containing protein [Chlamydiales bacterium]